jgi:tetratricopeptide (TPR) repeat protein
LDSRRGDFNAGIQLTIGQLYEELGDIDNAIAEYMKVGYIYPDSSEIVASATLSCGRLLEKQNKIEEAVKLYKKISEMDTKEAEFAKERLKAIEERK